MAASSFRTLAQLKNTQWESREAAMKDLKASGVKESGADYVLGEFKPGTWQLLDRTDIDVPPEPPKPERRKAARAKSEAKKPAKKAEAKAKAKDVPKPAPAPAPDEPETNDLFALPAVDGPYTFRIGEPIAQFDLAKTALSISRKIGLIIDVVDKDGKVARVIDGRLAGGDKAARKAGTRTPRAPTGEGKMATATRLLMRDDGATAKEISDATGWPTGQRHINKLAKLGGLSIEKLGDQKWRLIKS